MTFTADGSGLILHGAARRPDGSEEPRERIYTRRFDAYEFKPIPGTEGAVSISPSPDGEWVAFVATVSEQSSQLQLKKVRVDGRPAGCAMIDGRSSGTGTAGSGSKTVTFSCGTVLQSSSACRVAAARRSPRSRSTPAPSPGFRHLANRFQAAGECFSH